MRLARMMMMRLAAKPIGPVGPLARFSSTAAPAPLTAPLAAPLGGPGVQKTYRPESICFGCGPANHKGLQIDSHVIEIEGRSKDLPPLLMTKFQPKPEHQSYAGVLNAGVVGSLLDCHGCWAAAMAIMHARRDSVPPTVISAAHSIKLTQPVPFSIDGDPITISSEIEDMQEDRCYVKMYLRTGEDAASRCAEGEGWFAVVKPGCTPEKIRFNWGNDGPGAQEAY